jgi:ribosomal protein L32
MRHTRGHTRNRRSHHSLKAVRLTRDSETGSVHLRHRACLTTGKYRGRDVIDVTKPLEKKERRIKRKEELKKSDSAEKEVEDKK